MLRSRTCATCSAGEATDRSCTGHRTRNATAADADRGQGHALPEDHAMHGGRGGTECDANADLLRAHDERHRAAGVESAARRLRVRHVERRLCIELGRLVAYRPRHPDDGEPRRIVIVIANTLSDRIPVGPVHLCRELVDDGDERCAAYIALFNAAPAHDGNALRSEIAGSCHDVVAVERRLAGPCPRRLTHVVIG